MSEFFESEEVEAIQSIELPTLTLSKKICESMSGILVPEVPIMYVSKKEGFFRQKHTVSTIAAGFSKDPESRVYVVACLPGLELSKIKNPEELVIMTGPKILYNNLTKTCASGFEARVNYTYDTDEIQIDLNFAFKEKFEVYILKFVPFHLSNLCQQLLRV